MRNLQDICSDPVSYPYVRGRQPLPQKLLAKFLDLLQILKAGLANPTSQQNGKTYLMTEKVTSTKLSSKTRLCRGPTPTGKGVVNGKEVRIL